MSEEVDHNIERDVFDLLKVNNDLKQKIAKLEMQNRLMKSSFFREGYHQALLDMKNYIFKKDEEDLENLILNFTPLEVKKEIEEINEND